MLKIALVTYGQEPTLTSDDRVLAQSLKESGFSVVPVIWDNPEVPWSEFDQIIIRSCWDYHQKTGRFEAWLEHLESLKSRVLNPIELCRWNIRKSYMNELSLKGAKVPKTLIVPINDSRPLRELLAHAGLNEVVIKPLISLNGENTWRSSTEQALIHESQWSASIRTQSMIIQQFVPEILSEGELSFIFIDGVLSHCIRKKVTLPGEFRIQKEYGGTRETFEPPQSLIRQAKSILNLAGAETLLFSRVDGIDVGGELVLVELELIDPMLFFSYSLQSAERFTEAVKKRILS